MINHLSLLLLVKWKMLNLALQIFKVFVQILLNVNLSLDQSLLIFLLYVRQTWMTQLILAIFL